MKEKIKNFFDTKTTRGKIMRTLLFLIILTVIFVLCYFILRWTGLWEKVNSIDKIRDIVARGGAFSFIIFIVFQILQTTVLQIPAMFVTIAGAVIFGRWQAFLMSYIAIMIGSIIMFWIGRKAGRSFLYWLVGKEAGEMWIKRLSNGKYLFFLMMLFPMFPDDILCVVAGITNMSFPFFFWTNILARGLGTLCTVYLGSGAIIPYHGWGLVVWGVLIVVMLVLFYLSVKFKDKIDILISKIFKRKKVNATATNQKTNEVVIETTNSESSLDKNNNEIIIDKNNDKIVIDKNHNEIISNENNVDNIIEQNTVENIGIAKQTTSTNTENNKTSQILDASTYEILNTENNVINATNNNKETSNDLINNKPNKSEKKQRKPKRKTEKANKE